MPTSDSPVALVPPLPAGGVGSDRVAVGDGAAGDPAVAGAPVEAVQSGLPQPAQIGEMQDASSELTLGPELGRGPHSLLRRGVMGGPGGFRKTVVVKDIAAAVVADAATRRRVLEGAKLAAKLAHANIVQLYTVDDVLESTGAPGLRFISEHTESLALDVLLRQCDDRAMPLMVPNIVWIISSICRALEHAQTLELPSGPDGIGHGHLTPTNVIIGLDGHVRVSDFHLAMSIGPDAITPGRQSTGVHAYMAPEQIARWQIDAQSDIFSIGVMLYEMTTGVHPFRAETDRMTCTAICTGPIKLPSQIVEGYPPELEAIVMKAMARDRTQRYPSAADLRRELLHGLDGDRDQVSHVAMASVLRLLFPDNPISTSGKWRLPAASSSAPAAKRGSRALGDAGEDSGAREVLIMATIAVIVLSAVFWLLVFPQL